MKHYFLQEHTTDIRLKLEASTLVELFMVAVEGMAAIIKHDSNNHASVGSEIHKKISITSQDNVALLIDFLSDVLSESHFEYVIFTRVEISELTNKTLSAIVYGYPVESFDEDIKAVTYHEAYVIQNASGGYESQVIFDI